ncbi:MAG: TonB-dependent receptor [Dysgonamonadaceae bacterium]|jgi:TonB-dependent receptor|nr:TonB-dependent receptor [Dysgonamonadaceae bacterium]
MKSKKICFIVAFLMMTVTLLSQEGKSTLQGFVFDESGAVPGVQLVLKGTHTGAVSATDGSFIVSSVPFGKCILVVSFVGYRKQEIEVDIKAGLNVIPTIILSSSDEILQEVIVTGEMAPSQMKAYNMKKLSHGIVDFIASDAIGKLPDRNAAEAVQRISSVAVSRYHGEADRATVRGAPFTWTSTLMNGTRLPSSDVGAGRSTVLDVVPSELIEYCEVSKAITPDMESDAIGGSINFITRTAPVKRTLAISGAGGFNDITGKEIYNFSAVYGNRFFDKKFGIMLAASTWKRNWGTDEYTVDFNTDNTDPFLHRSIKSVMLKRYMGTRTTNGLNIAMEYNFNPLNKIYVRGLIDNFVDDRPVFESYFLYNTNQYQYNYRESKYNTWLYGGEFGGKHQLSAGTKFNWSLSDYYGSYKINSLPDNIDINYRGLPIITFIQGNAGFGGLYTHTDGKGYKFSSLDMPDGSGDSPDNLMPHATNSINDRQLMLSRLVLMRIINIEEDRTAQANISFDLSERLTVKAGGKFRNKQKDYRMLNRIYMPNAAIGIPNSPALTALADFPRGTFPNQGNFFNAIGANYASYAIDPVSSATMKSIVAEAVGKNNWYDASQVSDSTNMYDGYENAVAGYVMAEWNVTHNMQLYGGIRNEYTKAVLNGKKFDKASNILSKTTVENSYNSLLPMLLARYSVDDFTNIRAAYTKTFIRPLFSDFTPGQSVDVTGSVKTITRGNPDIKPTYANNFDLTAEHFFGNIGIVSAGIFYKDLDNLIFSSRDNETIDNENYYVIQSRNISNASLLGFEIAGNRRFDMLPGLFKGIGLEANYTFIKSDAEVPVYINGEEKIVKTPLQNQSKHLFNTILYYEMNGITVKIAGNYRGESLETISSSLPPDLWVWTDRNFTVDLAASYAINRQLRIFAEVQNITNEPVRMYLGDKSRTKDLEWSSVRGQIGIRYSIF